MKPGDELSPAEVGVVFGKLGRLDVVRLTGGEPFLREDFAEIAAQVLLKSNPSVLHTTTNGSFPERTVDFVRRFSQPRKLRFMVSLDGLPDEHDENRGKDVTFELALETIRRLAELRESHGIEVSVNHTVISAQSLEDNEGIRALMREINVDVHSVLAYAESSMYGAKLRGKRAEHLIVPAGYPLHPKLAGANVLGFVQRELDRVEEYGSVILRQGKRYYLRGLKARLEAQSNGNGEALALGEVPIEPQPPCVALRSHIRLLPDGSVPVCQFNTEKVGNLLRQSFDEVWQSAETKASRAWVDACPGCWAECEVMPNAIFTGDVLRHI